MAGRAYLHSLASSKLVDHYGLDALANNENPCTGGRPWPPYSRKGKTIFLTKRDGTRVVRPVVKKDIREISLLLNVLEHLPKTAGRRKSVLERPKRQIPVPILSQWESSS